jgi:cytochrome c-type biogenesis protein CcmH
MISRLVERLNQKPDDPEGWRMLGWSYSNTGRYAEAVGAYAKAAELRPAIADLQSSYGEAIVRASSETVTPEAKAAFDKALKLDPKDPRARFFMGLALEQQGDKTAAFEAWLALLKDAKPSDDWAGDLRQRVVDLGAELGDKLSPSLASELASLAPAHEVLPTQPGPTAADVKAAEGMSDEDRNAMVHGMVERLAARLAKSPRDADGWIKLMRARMVLGESDAAKEALKQALSIFSGVDQEQGRIAAAARELGISE